MKLSLYTLFLVFSFVLLPGFDSDTGGLRAQLLLPAEAVPDMTQSLYRMIREKHPAGFQADYVAALEEARAQVQKTVEAAVRGRDSLPYHEFVGLMAPLQRATDCGHLILHPYRDSLTDVRLRENYFPLSMQTVAGTPEYVLQRGVCTATDSLPPGTVIRSIDGTPTDQLLRWIAPFGGVNDQGNDGASLALAARGFSLRYQRYFGKQDSILLEVAGPGLGPGVRTLYPRHRPYVDPKKAKTDINRTLGFRFTPDSTTGILTIRSFSARKFHNGDYRQFIRKAMYDLNATGADKLIIDLRGNTGGRSSRIIDLFAYLTGDRFRFADRVAVTGTARSPEAESPRQQRRRADGAVSRRERKLQKALTRSLKPRKPDQRFHGAVAVLIDELTFSASGMFARYVQGSGRGILVGSTSGASAGVTYGGRSNLDKEKNLIGPNGEFRLLVNNILLQLPYAEPGNVRPNLSVRPTAEDLRAERDVVLEAAVGALTE